MRFSTTLLGLVAVASAQKFTSIFNITATPDQVINAQQQPAPGQPGAKGQFNFAINSKTETICYDITLWGVTGDYQSPARTATHIHESPSGRLGPPRIAFPNPQPVGGPEVVRRSVGCLTGPFTTGIKASDNATDTGFGFKLAQIEANPAGFFADSHTKLFPAGVVRGQLNQNFKIIKPKSKGGKDLITVTFTKTEEITITSCPPKETKCPYESTPLTTNTVKVYTTVCPISELPVYNSTRPVPKPSTPAQTKPVTANPAPKPATYPAPTPSKPAETKTLTPLASTQPEAPIYTYPPSVSASFKAPAGTEVPPVYTTPPTEFTGAAGTHRVGGALMGCALVAALW